MKCEFCIYFRETSESCFDENGNLIMSTVSKEDEPCEKFKSIEWKIRRNVNRQYKNMQKMSTQQKQPMLPIWLSSHHHLQN